MKLKRKTKFWLVVSAILALLLGLLVTWTVHKVQDWRWRHAGPIENHPVRIWDVNFAKEFNDLNEVQLAVAQAVGVPPVEDRDAAEHMKQRLVEIVDNDLYSVDELTHSIPFLVPSAAELLDRIGRNFQDSLSAKGLSSPPSCVRRRMSGNSGRGTSTPPRIPPTAMAPPSTCPTGTMSRSPNSGNGPMRTSRRSICAPRSRRS